ncbi:MAG: DsbA family protein [Paracoccaceae bacterium]
MRRSLITLTTAFALLATTALAGGLGAMTDAERTAFRDEVKQYLLENPEVLMEAMQVLQNRQDKTAADHDKQMLSDNADVIFKDPASWVGGNPDGNITVVEFMDYRCTYCRKSYSEVADLVKSDGNIRFVVKEYPILGDDSVASARFAIAVKLLHGDDAYAKVHDALITLRGAPDAETLARLATTMGFDPKPVLAMMGDAKVTAIIADNHALADKLNITGTPTFVIDQTMLRGYVPEDGMRQIVAQERAS